MNKIATVVGFFEETKGPQIQFDGEENPAEKEYPYLSSYSPKVDDKVFCMEFGESYIIIGKVNYQEEPFDLNSTLEENISGIKDDVATIEEDLKSTNKQLEDLLKNIEEKYLKIEDFTKEFKTNLRNNIQGKGECLVRSNMDVSRNNVDYIYVDSSNGTLYARRTNGQWSGYKTI